MYMVVHNYFYLFKSSLKVNASLENNVVHRRGPKMDQNFTNKIQDVVTPTTSYIHNGFSTSMAYLKANT